MNQRDFYNERKYCTYCKAYVPYLASPSECYCAQCGDSVRMMSPEDWQTFNHERSNKPRSRARASKPRAAKTAPARPKQVAN